MKQFVVADGKAGPEYEGVGPPYFSVDGKRLAYGATKGPCEKLVVVDGKEGAVYFMILGGNWFSPDGKRVAYMAFKNDFKKSVVVVDGREVVRSTRKSVSRSLAPMAIAWHFRHTRGRSIS